MLARVFVDYSNKYISTASGCEQLTLRVRLFVGSRQLKDEVKYPDSY